MSLAKNKVALQFNSIIVIVIFATFFLYAKDLEAHGCECSADWKRDHIKYHSLVIIFLYALSLFKPEFLFNNKILGVLLTIFSIIFVVNTIQFVRELRDSECECSKNWKRTFMEIYSYVSLSLYSLSLLLLLLIVFNALKK